MSEKNEKPRSGYWLFVGNLRQTVLNNGRNLCLCKKTEIGQSEKQRNRGIERNLWEIKEEGFQWGRSFVMYHLWLKASQRLISESNGGRR